MSKGFVKIPRRLFETRWWHQKRIFSESDAIIDLYQSADKKNMVSGSRRSFADRWLWDDTRVHRFFTRLQKDGYIKVQKTIKGTVIEILDFGTGAPPTAPPSAPPTAPPTAPPKSPSTKGFQEVTAPPSAPPTAPPSAPSRAYRNDIIISSLSKNDSSLRSESENKENNSSLCSEFTKEKNKIFVKPTVEQIRAYCEEQKIVIDCEHFYDYYESIGWKVSGKGPMKDWKAAVRNWLRNDKKYNMQHRETKLIDNSPEQFRKKAW